MAFGADPDYCLLTQSGGAATNKRIGPPAVSGRSNFASWDPRCPACPFPNLRPPQGKALVLRRESCCPSSLASQQISCSRASNSGVEKNSPSVISKPSHSFLMVTVPGFWLSPLRILLMVAWGTAEILLRPLGVMPRSLHNSRIRFSDTSLNLEIAI